MGPRLILASTSPRRRALLAEAGVAFLPVHPDVDERCFCRAQQSPQRAAERCAWAKAEAVSENHPEAWVLAADTVIDYRGRLMGKPRDRSDAAAMLADLFRHRHEVVTAVVLTSRRLGRCHRFSERSAVVPKGLDESQIRAYLDRDLWQGKAGAYGIQDDGTDAWLDRIEGSLTNVIGLPMERLLPLLRREGLAPESHGALDSHRGGCL